MLPVHDINPLRRTPWITSLVIFGNNIEDRFRKVPYLLFYLFCGYVAAYGFAFANRTSVEPLIGASGAIAGLGAVAEFPGPARRRAGRAPRRCRCRPGLLRVPGGYRRCRYGP